MASSLHDTEEIVRHALSADLIGPSKRRLLLDGLPMGFVYSLPTVSRPIDQLRFDLMELSRTPRLIGLSEPPLAIWLRNAAKMTAPRPESGFFDERASALDGKPKRYGGGEGPSAAPASVSHSNAVGPVLDGSVGVVHGNVMIHNYASNPPAATSQPPAPPTPAPRPRLTARPLIVVGLGVSSHDADAGARPYSDAISARYAIHVPPRAWEHPPTHGDWRLVAHRIEALIDGLDSDANCEIGLFPADDTPAAMVAWFVLCARRRKRRVHVFDPERFAAGEAWRPLPPGRLRLDEALEVGLSLSTSAGDAIALQIDLGVPSVDRSPVVAGATQARVTLDDDAWQLRQRTAAEVADSLDVSVHALRKRAARVPWHVFYDGPPSLWARTVRTLLDARQRLTIYAADVEGHEHEALELPTGKWAAPPDVETLIDDHYDIFLAYPTEAHELASKLFQVLDPHYKVFFDRESLVPGDIWTDALPLAQANARATLLLVTPESSKAWWQSEEIIAAIELAQREGSSHRIIPLLARGMSRKALPHGLRRVQAAEWVEGRAADEVARELRGALDAACRSTEASSSEQ